MYKIDYNITIGDKRLNYLSALQISSNVENLADTATISLPSHIYNKSLDVKKYLTTGKNVEISLGYNGNLVKEFSGYIKNITDYGDEVQILCEDAIYQLRQIAISDQVLNNVTLEQLIKKLLPGQKFECAYSYTYSSFTCANLTAYKLLSLIQDETKADIFLRDDVLYIQPCYTTITDKIVRFNFAKNIQANGLSLEYKTTEDRALEVVAKGKDKQGKEIQATAGKKGEDVLTFDMKGATTKQQLQTLADELYARKCYDGLEGSFNAWLIPRVEAGWSVELTDHEDSRNNGRYFVVATELNVSDQGCTRKVQLGKRLTY